ncbi:MAG: hypothetical protein ACK4FJ_18685 [Ferrovibrio sp.]|uniref:hypothetical protein n=1 Tax=Ferrovibrio sp. TaxID=1917215 RepID=UPI00391B9676
MKARRARRTTTTTKATSEDRGRREGYRSGLEDKIAEQLRGLGIEPNYEALTIRYTPPQKTHRYTPDFPLDNGVIVESKGRFVSKDRVKHLAVKAEHPDLDIRFVFSNSRTRLSKISKTTYADWCVKHGFQFADKLIPLAWINEPPCERRLAALRKATSK